MCQLTASSRAPFSRSLQFVLCSHFVSFSIRLRLSLAVLSNPIGVDVDWFKATLLFGKGANSVLDWFSCSSSSVSAPWFSLPWADITTCIQESSMHTINTFHFSSIPPDYQYETQLYSKYLKILECTECTPDCPLPHRHWPVRFDRGLDLLMRSSWRDRPTRGEADDQQPDLGGMLPVCGDRDICRRDYDGMRA